jgi:hypothetical protein
LGFGGWWLRMRVQWDGSEFEKNLHRRNKQKLLLPAFGVCGLEIRI